MVQLNIDMPASCDSCPFKGARLCYITVWLGTEYKEVPEEGRAEWCPMREADRWIPVTERLPELDTDVLITDQYGDVWQATYIDWCGDERFVTAEESITIEVVIAWRPLPEPYTEEEA